MPQARRSGARPRGRSAAQPSPSQAPVELRPVDVHTPPSGRQPPPPVVTSIQELPLKELDWVDFERLCFRLAGRTEGVEDWQRYGRNGQAQAGIDLFVRRNGGRYSAWQCKRYEVFKVRDLDKAVAAFEGGSWLKRSDELLLCVTARVDDTAVQEAAEKVSERLSAHGVNFRLLGPDKLSDLLKSEPAIVADFFGAAWVEAFCGNDGLQRLRDASHRLDRSKLASLRTALLSFYSARFTSLDRGLFAPDGQQGRTFTEPPLSRFLVPDVLTTPVEGGRTTTATELPAPRASGVTEDARSASGEASSPSETFSAPLEASTRVALPSWLGEAPLAVILADAGLGKTTALRALAIDLLTGNGVFPEVAAAWGNHIPIYIPFARWTHLAALTPRGVSLEEAVAAWLGMFSVGEDLQRLVCEALADRRLLLLVDGLDEWSDETAARTVLSQLDTVVRSRGVSAVVTSRPLGFARLGSLGPPWRTARLAPLSEQQQRRLVYLLLDTPPLDHVADVPTPELSPRARTARTRAEEFLGELDEVRGLRALAESPLLLAGLLSLKQRDLVLPRGRFAAHEQLTNILLSLHPEARARSAADATPRFPPALSDPDARRRVLGKLAYYARKSGTDSGIPLQDARRALVDALLDEDDFGLPADQAKAAAASLLAVNAETRGILVEKAPGEVGFSHAVFEEHLAAFHLSSRPQHEQRDFVANSFPDPRWMNVVLNLFRLQRRPQDVEDLVEVLERQAVYGVGRIVRDLILAEIAFGEASCPGRTRRRLAATALDEVERGTWMPSRAAILRIALNGLGSGVGHDAVVGRLRRWFPDTQSYRDNLFAALARWPRSDELEDVLWRALLNPGEGGCGNVSKAMASVFGGDSAVGAKLVRALWSGYVPETSAQLLTALGEGWPDHPNLDQAIEDARISRAPILRFAAIRLAVGRNRHSVKDRDFLLAYATSNSPGFYWLRPEVADTLLRGWPGDGKIFAAALSAWSNRGWRDTQLDGDVAARLVLRGFKDEPKVLDALVAELATEDYAFSLTNNIDLVQAAFQRHPVLSNAIDEWLERRAKKGALLDHQAAQARVISGSEQAKARLIDEVAQGGRYVFWPIWALLAGWDLQEPEIRAALQAFARRPHDELQHAAHHLPAIVADSRECRQLLLEVARLPNLERVDFVVQAFVELRVGPADSEVVEALVGAARRRRTTLFDGIPALVAHFGQAPAVRGITEELLQAKGAPLAAMAHGYRDDAEMRSAILQVAQPLPENLRLALAGHAARREASVPDLEPVTSGYEAERQAPVRAVAEVGFVRRLRRDASTGMDLAVTRLAREVNAVGPDLDSVRGAALTAAIETEYLPEVLAAAKNVDREPDVDAFGRGLYRNSYLLETVARKWGYLARAFGTNVIACLSSRGDNPVQAWEQLAPFLAGAPEAERAFVDWCATHDAALHPAGLQALRRLAPRTTLLREHSLRRLQTGWGAMLSDVQAGIASGAILGADFGSDPDVVRQLVAGLEKKYVGATVGLSICAREDPSLRALFQSWESRTIRLAPVDVFNLLACFGAPEMKTEKILQFVNETTGRAWDLYPENVDAIVRILSRDSEVVDLLVSRLSDPAASPDEIASIPRLLSAAGLAGPDVREWCEQRLADTETRPRMVEYGMDVCAGSFRAVRHSLLDVLLPYGTA